MEQGLQAHSWHLQNGPSIPGWSGEQSTGWEREAASWHPPRLSARCPSHPSWHMETQHSNKEAKSHRSAEDAPWDSTHWEAEQRLSPGETAALELCPHPHR